MNKTPISIIIKEYYDIVSPVLAYMTCEKLVETERQILRLLCEVNGSEDSVEECWAMIDDAKCIQTFSDGALLASSDATKNNIAYDIKTDVLAKGKISKLKNFEEFTFVKDLQTDANAGKKSSCKLLAFLNWLGATVPKNVKTAQNIWSSLTMIGDQASIKMLIYSYSRSGDSEKAEKWTHIYDILQSENESFSAIAVYSAYPQYTEEEVQAANMIMFISQKYAVNEGAPIDRAMVHYALNSKADYQAKMDRLSRDANYYVALHFEDKFSDKKYGF